MLQEVQIMRVMTFNIQHCHEWLENRINIECFANAVKEHGADFCGLNEVRGNGPVPGYTDQTNKLGDAIGYNRFFGQTIRVAGVAPYGNAFVTKYPVISAEAHMIPETDDRTDPSNYERRGFISAIVDVCGREVCFMVCHMGLSAAEQRCAVKSLCDFLDDVKLPVILMGDFNTTPGSGILDPIFERLSNTDDVSVNPGEYTYPSYDPKIKIDYILYRGLKCTRTETVCKVISDHFPIIADFEI